MGYESMGLRELQAACKSRGLPSGRSKAELVQRLTEHDIDPPEEPELRVETEPETVAREVVQQPPVTTPAPTAAPPMPVVVAEPPEGLMAPTVYQQTFPATPDGPSEDQHAAHRRDTRQAALDAGHAPRGDARRVSTVDGQWVYEISIRRPS